MGFELSDRFETSDGSRPHASTLADATARANPLSAFTVLSGGDVFDSQGRPPVDGRARAQAWVAARIKIEPHAAADALVRRVVDDMVRQVCANLPLIARMHAAKPITVDLVPPGVAMHTLGYPATVTANASGLYWDHPSWAAARIALRQDRLDEDAALVTHELAHAIHYLAFTRAERDTIYRVLRPSFGSVPAMDEVFAIYSEREFLDQFSHDEKRAPGVYGFTRRQWNENHLFTRFVRKLYLPHQPLAGPQMARRKNPYV